MANFTTADTKTLLSQPGYFYYRTYGSVGGWNKAVFANGATYAPSVETTEITFDDVGIVQEQVSNETVEVSLNGRVLDLDFINDLSGGLFTKSTVAGTPVVGATQAVTAGNWTYLVPFLLDGQNASGAAQTIASVVGSVDGALVADTDYFAVKLEGAGWGIYIKDTATVTTLTQTITVTYGYTPPAQTILKRGGIKTVTPIELAFQTIDDDGNYVKYFFYKCYTNGANGHGFGSEQSAEPITMSLAFTAKKDTNRADGDQVFSIVKGGVSLG